jgi:Rrf2 family protein
VLVKKTRYAILALVRLAENHGKGPRQSAEIATTEKIPQRFLEIILNDLKKAGYLGSKSGKDGGFFLIKDPSEIDLQQIVDHFEGSTSWVPCISEKSYQPCEFAKNEADCRLRMVYSEIRENTREILGRTTLHDLMQKDNSSKQLPKNCITDPV